jgi:hypothetical protein
MVPYYTDFEPTVYLPCKIIILIFVKTITSLSFTAGLRNSRLKDLPIIVPLYAQVLRSKKEKQKITLSMLLTFVATRAVRTCRRG